jgi:hypothetical protein
MNERKSVFRLALALVLVAPAVGHAAVPVGSEFQVNEAGNGAQQAPRLTFNPASGEYVVAWQSQGQDGDGNGVFARRYDSSGNAIGAEFQVNSNTAGDQANPVVAGLPDGGFVVFWESLGQDGESFGVFGRRFDASATPASGEFQANTYTLNSQETPEVCSDADGNVLVVWESRDHDGDNAGIFGQRYDASLSPAGGEFQVNTFTISLQGAPRIACQQTAGGDRIVMWESLGQEGGFDRGVFAQRLTYDGSPIGNEFQVNEYIPYHQSVPAAAIGDDGSFVVAWNSNTQDGESMGVFLRRFDSAGSPLGDETQVNSFIFNRQRNPRIGLRDNGDMVVVWESYDEEGRRQRWGSFAQEYSIAGDPVGREFLVNSHVRRGQGDPDIAMNPADGGFLVVWNSELQDGADFGVFAQRYTPGQLCAPTPRTGCVASGVASFRIRNRGCDNPDTPCNVKNVRDLVQWKWARPATPATVSPYGDDEQPDTGDEEALAICIYDEAAGSPALVGTMVVPPSGNSFGKSCWRGTKVKKYRDRDQSPNGVRKLVIAGRSVRLVARGPLIQPPVLPLALDSHLTVQLVGEGGDCVESVFDGTNSENVLQNDADVVQVRN